MLDQLNDLTDLVTDSPWTYVVVLLLVAGDAILPLFPGESTVVAASVLAADGDLRIGLVWMAAVAGAFIGDLVGYALGRVLGTRITARYPRGEKGRRRLREAEDALNRRGTGLIAAAQFIPGGRNVIMIGAGTLEYPLRRFLPAEAVGVTLWATFQCALGYVGGRALDDTLTALVVSLGMAFVVGVSLERGQAWWERRHRSRPGDDTDAG